MDEVRVDYVFRNRTEGTSRRSSPFPMPDIEGNPYGTLGLPEGESDNFLGFEVTIDGKPVKPSSSRGHSPSASTSPSDLEAQWRAAPPFGEAATAALAKLPEAVRTIGSTAAC